MVVYKIGTVIFFILLIGLLSYKAIKDAKSTNRI